MFKDWDDHCYFDTWHCTECVEEVDWIEPWEEEIKKRRKGKKLSVSLCKRFPEKDDRSTPPRAPMLSAPLQPYYQKALKHIRKESMVKSVQKASKKDCYVSASTA